MTTRRGVLTVTAAAALTAVAACKPDKPQAAPGFNPADWSSVRAQFDLSSEYAQFAAFVFASHPAPVRAAIDAHRRGLDQDPTGYLHGNQERLEAAVATAAAGHLRTGADQIAFTDSTTMGLGLLYTGLRLEPGDEVLTTEHDFYATHESLRLRGIRDGVTVRRVRLYDDPATASADQIVSRLANALTPRTRIVAVTWVHSGTGVKLPVRAIADAIRARTGEATLLCVDGVHGFAAEATTPDELGADFLVSGCHKWLFGPRGTGLIWGRPAAWNRFTPVVPTFGTGAGPATAATPGGYHSFEHRWALAEAFGFATAIGPARIAARVRELAGALKEGLAGIGGVVLRTPASPQLSAGVVCCELAGLSPAAAVARLRERHVIASVTPYATPYLRFGTSIVTDERDVEQALRAVRALG
jgi:selenocysteine lyase/cysteine desulfurase